MDPNIAEVLQRTNVWVAIIAVVSVFQGLVLIGIGVGAFMAYRKVMALVNDLEARQIAPLRAKVEGILADVKSVTSLVSQQTERVDHAIAGTMERVDDTAERVKSTLREKVNRATGIVRGVRAVIISLLGSESTPKPPATAAGRV